MANAFFGLSLKTSGVQVIGENCQCMRSFLVWGGGGFECVFDSVKKKSTFIFVAFINDERMGNVRSTFLFSSHPQSM